MRRPIVRFVDRIEKSSQTDRLSQESGDRKHRQRNRERPKRQRRLIPSGPSVQFDQSLTPTSRRKMLISFPYYALFDDVS